MSPRVECSVRRCPRVVCGDVLVRAVRKWVEVKEPCTEKLILLGELFGQVDQFVVHYQMWGLELWSHVGLHY